MNALWCRVLFSCYSGYWLYLASVNGHKGNQGLGGQDFPVRSLIKDLGFTHQDSTSFSEDPGLTNQDLTVSRPQEIDFKFNGQDPVFLIDQTESGVPGRMVGHGGQYPRMNVLILLSMAVQHLQPGFQVPYSVFLNLVAHIPDKAPGIIPGQKIAAFRRKFFIRPDQRFAPIK